MHRRLASPHPWRSAGRKEASRGQFVGVSLVVILPVGGTGLFVPSACASRRPAVGPRESHPPESGYGHQNHLPNVAYSVGHLGYGIYGDSARQDEAVAEHGGAESAWICPAPRPLSSMGIPPAATEFAPVGPAVGTRWRCDLPMGACGLDTESANPSSLAISTGCRDGPPGS